MGTILLIIGLATSWRFADMAL